MTPVLRVSNLSVSMATPSGRCTVVDDVSFEVAAQETLGIVGESGSGKTVTALAVMRLLPRGVARVEGGRVELLGRDLLALDDRAVRDVRGRDVSMVFQEPMSSLNPAFTVGEQIAEVVRRHRGASRRAAWQRAVEMLGVVGIPAPAQRAGEYPHQFSGGMRQRVMIAAALACDPQLLIADEPTTALDVTVQADVLDLLARLQREFSMAVLLITHDLGVVARTCDRMVVMYAGQVVEHGPRAGVLGRPGHPYAEALLRSVPKAVDRGRRLWSISGSPPVPGNFPPGCRFAPRCAHAQDRCHEAAPALLTAGDGREVRCVRAGEIELVGVGRR